MSSLGTVSSISANQIAWQTTTVQDRDAARAASEAAAGDAFYRRSEFAKAWERYQRAVEFDPTKGAYFLSLGVAALMSGRPDIGERHMLQAIRLAPNHADAHEALAQYYMESRQLPRALKHSETALRLDPKSVDYRVTRAAVLIADSQTVAAWDLIKPLVDAGARNDRLALLHARLAPRFGQERQALLGVESALRAGIHRSLEHQFHFAAASLLDRLGRYDEAFPHARRANELIGSDFDPAGFVNDADRKIGYFTRNKLRCLPKSMVKGRPIVFIVGMPRSGTTLVEQILASHPQVFGAGESPALLQVQAKLCDTTWSEGTAFPECLESLSIALAGDLAGAYLSAMELPGSENATWIADKTPMNFLHLGLVQLLLPNSRVIHCTRNPMDTCLSCYFTNFMSGQEYSRDLEKLAAVFRGYQRLMRHWKQELSIPIHEVRYEDLVLAPEAQSRRMTDFLGLPWDERCLKFYENPRRVYSSSMEQVRQPIYLSSIGRWKNYQKHIGKLIDALATA